MKESALSRFYEDFHRERGKKGTVEIQERLTFISKEVGKDRDVIELGCRYGELLSHFLEGNRVIGVDIDREAINICHARFGIEAKVVDLNGDLPFPPDRFDVVVLTEVLEHLPYPWITLDEIVRILRIGGKFVGSVPNGTHLRNRLRFLFRGVVENDRTHIHHFSVRTLDDLLSRYFDDVHILPVSGRYRLVSDNLLSNYLLFSCRMPKKNTN
jgi:SAM-dependent methyltransferase